MTRAEDLAELALTESDDDPTTIRRAYLKLSIRRHPDKGGTKEAFQRLSSAYHRLRFVEPEERSNEAASPTKTSRDEPEESGTDEDWGDSYDDDHWYEDHFSFFRNWHYEGFGDFDDYYDYFTGWEETREARRKAWAKQRKEDLKRGYDYRDKRAKNKGGKKCMFCGENTPITKRSAEANGLNWGEYSREVDCYPTYRTCWACKTSHKSVLTEKQAIKKFARVLDFNYTSKKSGNEYRPVFWFLKVAGRSFHHQPVTDACGGETRKSEYYWYPDLEREALARGWKPRGEMKEQVPWKRKDEPESAVIVVSKPRDSNNNEKKRKRERKLAIVTPTKKENGSIASDEAVVPRVRRRLF